MRTVITAFGIRTTLAQLKATAPEWHAIPVAERVSRLRQWRKTLARTAPAYAEDLVGYHGRSHADTLVAEVMPLAAAMAWLERAAPSLLAPQRRGVIGRPLWLPGVRSTVVREPFGLVLILAPANYPLLLAGVQMVQALAAGNAVAVKPAPGTAATLQRFVDAGHKAGVPMGALHLLPDSHETGAAALEGPIDLVVLTGSAATGRAVRQQLAPRGIPVIEELSGADAVLLLPDADLERAARAIAYGLTLNGGATCIAPRRIFGTATQLDALVTGLALPTTPVPLHPPAIERMHRLHREAGAAWHGPAPEGDRMAPAVILPASADQMTADIFGPVAGLIPVATMAEAVATLVAAPEQLGAAIFGNPAAAAQLAAAVPAGVVTINDLIVPTADPRLPFGGRQGSGQGVTRGVEGLLALTRPKVVITRSGRMLPHLEPERADAAALFSRALRWLYG